MTRLAWLLVAVGVLIVCALLVAAFLLGRRARNRSSPSTKATSPSGGWREILGKLPVTARSLPVVVVVGERGSGKSRLIQRAFGARTGFAGHAVTARDDFRISAYAPGPLLIQVTSAFPGAILAEASMSFLGLGAPPGTPSWGALVDQGTQYLLVAPHVALFPGLALAVTVLGFNFLGDAVRDALDPKRQGFR